VTAIGDNYLAFGNEMCDMSTYRDPNNAKRPHYLKHLAQIIGIVLQLYNSGASISNSLIVDHITYRNILNLPYNAVHPPPCTMYSEAKIKEPKLSYLQNTMIPFLEALLSFGLLVPEFCELNSKVSQPRCMPDSELHNQFIQVTPKCQKGIKVPYMNEDFQAMGSSS